MNLTTIQREIFRISDLPIHRRMTEARKLINDLDEVLASGHVAPEIARHLWISLGRRGTGQPIIIGRDNLTPEEARAAVIAALNPDDPIGAVKDAADNYGWAVRAAQLAKTDLARAVAHARRYGISIKDLADTAEFSIQTIHTWINEHGASVTEGEGTTAIDPATTYRVRTTILTDNGTEQVIDTESITGEQWQAIHGTPLSADDTGSKPGQRYRVELIPAKDTDDEPTVIGSYETTAE